MELKEFTNNNLTRIVEGVQAATDNAAGKGYMVNPIYDKKTIKTYGIRFYLAVERDGSANIKVLRGGVTEKSMNRISFEVEMTLPGTPINTPPERPLY